MKKIIKKIFIFIKNDLETLFFVFANKKIMLHFCIVEKSS
jgi:hypothetical protein